MVYCVKCGTKNPEDAKICVQCGTHLYSLPDERTLRHESKECFGTSRGREPYERVEEECFGIPRGGAVVGLAIGLIIILAGLSLLFQELFHINIPWWPFVVILFGILILIGALHGLRRRY